MAASAPAAARAGIWPGTASAQPSRSPTRPSVDLDATLTVIAGNLYRLLARQLPRYENATPDKLWRHFLDATGTVHTTNTTLTVDLNIRTYHPVLIAAGLADTPTPIPWLNDRELRFRFPPR